MKTSLIVPSIACEGCANTITKAIKSQDPEAKIVIDVPQKIVTVESESTVLSIRQAIENVGHIVEA